MFVQLSSFCLLYTPCDCDDDIYILPQCLLFSNYQLSFDNDVVSEK
jgi:hypothetical protein